MIWLPVNSEFFFARFPLQELWPLTSIGDVTFISSFTLCSDHLKMSKSIPPNQSSWNCGGKEAPDHRFICWPKKMGSAQRQTAQADEPKHFGNLRRESWYLGSGWSVDHRSTGSGCEPCWADWWLMRVGGTAASPPPAGSGVAARVDSCCRTVEGLRRWQQGTQEIH